MREYVVAGKFADAIMTAETKWGWVRTAHSRWKRPTGEEVFYIAEAQQLLGLPKGTRIWIVPGWHKNKQLEGLEEIMQTRQMVMGDSK